MSIEEILYIYSNIDAFFEKARENFISLSYEDIRLIPHYSEIHPSEITLGTYLTRNIQLSHPLISAAMDTVTESKAAIVMAKSGGIGIIHKNFHPDPEIDIRLQVKEVNKVKHHLHGLVKNPIGFPKDITLGHLLDVKKQNDYKFSTFLVYDEDRLAGLVTRSVIKYNRHNPHVPLKDIMVRDVFTKEECSMAQAYQLMLKHQIGTIVMTDEEKHVKGLYTFTDVENLLCPHKNQYTLDQEGSLRVGAAIGIHDEERLDALYQAGVDVVVVDSAHGDSKAVLSAFSRYKEKCSDLDFIVGNISTENAAKRLIDHGVDAIKVGQGPGQICSTRIISGIGVMQADAVHRVAKISNPENVPVIADGGIRYSGDIPIALACGASTVMLGQLLSGCEESPGERLQKKGKLYKIYRGMASLEAMASKGGSDRYLKKAQELKKLVPEGITKRIPYKGFLEDQIFMLLEGTKAGLGYCGAINLGDFKKQARLVRIMTGGIHESHPDTKGMIENPPNYSSR